MTFKEEDGESEDEVKKTESKLGGKTNERRQEKRRKQWSNIKAKNGLKSSEDKNACKHHPSGSMKARKSR